MVDSQTALEKAQNRTPTLDKCKVEKLQNRHRQAAERFTAARQSFRLQEEGLKNLQSKLHAQDLPRIMAVPLLSSYWCMIVRTMFRNCSSKKASGVEKL